MDSASDLTPTPYTPLPDHHLSPPLPRKSLNFTTATILISLLLLLVSLLTLLSYHTPSPHATQSPPPFRLARGVAEGVSAKSNPSFSDSVQSFNWTNAMFSWQRTAFHFQPEGNWMNGNFNSISDPPLLFSLHYIYNNDTNFKILLWVFFFCGFWLDGFLACCRSQWYVTFSFPFNFFDISSYSIGCFQLFHSEWFG